MPIEYFNIENGKGLMTIKMSSYLNYLEFNKPSSFNWLADGPASACVEYLASRPISWSIKSNILESFNQQLPSSSGQTNEAAALQRLRPILDMFENGRFSIECKLP